MNILHLVLNEFVNDNRVLRAVSTARQFGEVHIYALHGGDLAEHEEINGCFLRRIRLLTRSWSKHPVVQLFKYAELVGRMVAASRQFRPGIVHAHDLNALPIGYLTARLAGARLIYDSHELWSGIDIMDRLPGWMRRIGLFLERRLAARSDAVITVCNSIADVMAEALRIPRPTVIRNLPELESSCDHRQGGVGPLRGALGLTLEIPILLYQGELGPRRGLSALIETMELIRNTAAVLVMLGNGSESEPLQKLVARKALRQRVRFHPAVSPQELPRWTRDATIGVYAMEGAIQNHRLALPNKLFEFIHARLPVIVTDLPEMARIVKSYGVGEVFPDGRPDILAQKVDAVLSDAQRLEIYRAAAHAAAKELNWERERHILVDLYRSLQDPAGSP